MTTLNAHDLAHAHKGRGKYLACFDLENGPWLPVLERRPRRKVEETDRFWLRDGLVGLEMPATGMVSSGPYFQAWCERLFRKYNILAPQHGFGLC